MRNRLWWQKERLFSGLVLKGLTCCKEDLTKGRHTEQVHFLEIRNPWGNPARTRGMPGQTPLALQHHLQRHSCTPFPFTSEVPRLPLSRTPALKHLSELCGHAVGPLCGGSMGAAGQLSFVQICNPNVRYSQWWVPQFEATQTPGTLQTSPIISIKGL